MFHGHLDNGWNGGARREDGIPKHQNRSSSTINRRMSTVYVYLFSETAYVVLTNITFDFPFPKQK